MALNCDIKDRIFTFNGKDYGYNEFRALMYDGLLERVPELTSAAKETLATEEGKTKVEQAVPKGAVDASDVDAMQGLMDRHDGFNASNISKPRLISRILNGVLWLSNNKLGYDANTGKGNRIFVAESKADYQRITKDVSGKEYTGGGVAVPRYDANGKYMGADIYINLDTKSLSTVAHELAHVALMEYFAGDSKLFKKFIAAIRPSTSVKDLAYLDEFVQQYENKEIRPEEFLAEMTALIEKRFADGKVGAKELSALSKLAEAIKQFINKLTGGLVFPVEKESDVRAFFNALGQSIAVGGKMKEGLAEAAAREVKAESEATGMREAVERKEEEEVSVYAAGTGRIGGIGRATKGETELGKKDEAEKIKPKPRREIVERKEGELPPRGRTASIAPFYRLSIRDIADAERVAKTPAYKNFESTLNDLADAMGVKIDRIKPGVGKWGGIMELSAKVQFAPGQKFAKIREYAAIMGALAPESQDATIAGEYVKEGDKRATGYAIRIPTNDIDAAIALAESSGLYGLDIDTDSSEAIIFASNEDDVKQAESLADQFRIQGIGTGEFTAEPLLTEFIGEAKRADILKNVSNRLQGEGGRQQGGARLRNLVKLAQERDAAFQRLKGYEPTREKYAELRNRQIELLEKGQDLSELDQRRLASNRKRLTPAIEQQFGSWQEAYQESKDEIAESGDRIAESFGGYNIPFNIKNIGRATIKTLDWYMGRPTLLGDGARTTIIVDDIAKADDVFDRIKEEYYSTREENYTTDLGYPKRLIEVLTANGRLAEFQVMTMESYLAKDGVKLFPEDKRIEAEDSLNKIQSTIGAEITDGLGHLFYEIQRDPKVSKELRNAAKEPSNLYYKAFMDPQSMSGKGEELMKSVADFIDKIEAQKSDEGTWAAKHWTKNQELINRFRESYSEKRAPKRREVMERKEDEAFNGIEEPKTPVGDTKTVTVDGKERTVFNSEGRPIHPTVEGVRNFWRWFGDSKVVDDEGRPLVVYHGTFGDFSVFDAVRAGENTDGNASSEAYAQTAKVGFWFSSEPMAGPKAGYTVDMPVYLAVENPNREMSLDWLAQGLERMTGQEYREQLSSEGFDGVVLADEEFGGTSYIAFRPEQIKSATGNYGRFDPRRREIVERKEDEPASKKPSGKQWPSEEEIKNSTSESSAEFLTVVRRRLEALGVENREVERERLMNSRNEIPIGDYQSFKEDAEALFAQMTLLNPEMLSKTPVEQVKALVSEIGKIKNETTETYFSALVVNATNDMINSKKLSAKAKRELEGISADVVSEMAHAARARGQANAVLNDIYNDFPLFAFKVKSKAIIQEMNAQLDIQTAGEDGKKASEIVKESQDAIESVIDESPELKEVIDLADDINAAFNDDAVDDINANKRTPLDSRPSVTAQQLIEQKAKYDEIVDKLEKSLDNLKIKLARFNRLYAVEKARREHYAQMIADLQADIKKREALIERLKKSNAKISAQNYVYKKQIEALKDKINDLRDINKLLAANKIISPKRRERLIKKMLDLAAAGKIRDNDFKAVFAEIIGVPYISTRDEYLIQHMAKAIKFFNDKNMKEMAEMYTRKMNNYLERVSKEPWDSFRIARLITSMFFNSVLSGLGTLFNALVGSIMMGGTRFVAATTRFAWKNRSKGGVGATLYGVRRMLQEMPTAVSKGMFNQRAYDNLGTSWNSDQLSRGGDPYEVHLLNGFFDQFDRVINDAELSNKSAAAIALVGSVMVQVNRFTALMKFIDPVVRHSLATHLQAMDEYIQMREEIGVMVKENKAPKDVMEAWSKRFSLGLFEKIDLMSQTGDFARLRALSQAKSEVKELNARRIKTPPWYVRRRTSEIMRQQKDAETMKVYDRIAADMVMMGEPTGVLGAIWDGAKGLTQLRAKREGEKYHTLKTFMNVFFSTSVLAFGRITASGMNEAIAATPLVGWIPSQMGLLFNKNKDKFDKEVAGQKFAVSAFSTAIFMLLVSHMFEIEDAGDDDEEDQNQDGVLYDLFGKRVRIKENPDAVIRMTSNAYGTKSKNQGISEGRENHSMQIKVDGEWTDWVSFRLWPQISIMGSMIGRISDDVNHFYIEPDAGKVAKPTSASQFFTSVPLSAVGEMTFATIPRFINGLKYDEGAAFSRLLISPYAAVIQPSAYRDMIATTKSLEGASKKGEYMPEGFKETSKAILTSVYGINYLISNDVTDEYGLPIKVIDPWRNWWKLTTDVERRSLEHPEVAMRFMYPNTHVAANPKTMRIEKVDKIVSYVTPDGGTSYASVGELQEMYGAKYFSKPVSREVELTKEQQEKSSLLNKSIYRALVLQNYDFIMNEAKYGESVGEIGGVESGEVVSYYLDKFLSASTDFTSRVFARYAAGLVTEEELSEMVNSNKELADSLSMEIKERGPLPKSARTTAPRANMMYEQILGPVIE